MPEPQVVIEAPLSIQVCVPEGWNDNDVVAFAEAHVPCGTEHGWQVRRDPERLRGAPVRNPCGSPERTGFVHVMLDA